MSNTPTCEDCGADPLGGGRWCLTCFQHHSSMPKTPREIETAARRRKARRARRRYRRSRRQPA